MMINCFTDQMIVKGGQIMINCLSLVTGKGALHCHLLLEQGWEVVWGWLHPANSLRASDQVIASDQTIADKYDLDIKCEDVWSTILLLVRGEGAYYIAIWYLSKALVKGGK